MSRYVDGAALVRVVVVSLLLGAGIPAVFSLGVRSLAWDGDTARPAIRTVAAGLCFLVVIAAIVFGIYTIMAS
ncbi:hypothetical protein ACPPVS_06805 [Cellulomonas sp. McL0617]|uniref:hypothetical protein n=1 Tax=Cellulomonas sp. McL0617 TaxID=3415675 RepID=UPI003CFB05E2